MDREAGPLSRTRVRRIYRTAVRYLTRSWRRTLEQFFYERWRVRVQISEREALRLLVALYTGKTPGTKGPRFPDIYRQLVRQKEWLAKKWFWLLRREVERGRLNIESYYRVYVTVVRPGVDYIVSRLVHLAPGSPYACRAQAECYSRRVLGIDVSDIIEPGRLEVEPADLPWILDALCKYAPNRPVMITYSTLRETGPHGEALSRYRTKGPRSRQRGYIYEYWGKLFGPPCTLLKDREALEYLVLYAEDIIMWSLRPAYVEACEGICT